jgi:hypothetical protein
MVKFFLDSDVFRMNLQLHFCVCSCYIRRGKPSNQDGSVADPGSGAFSPGSGMNFFRISDLFYYD